MEKYIAYIAVIFVTLFLYINVQKYNDLLVDYHEDTQLQANVNMASDTALSRMILESEDLGLDYYYFGRVQINPRVGIDTFRRSMALLEYDTDSDMALGLIDSKFIGGIIICYDGYYAFDDLNQPVIKMPYQYKDTSGKRYLVDLTDKYIKELNSSTGATTNIKIESNNTSEITSQIEGLINKEINIMIQNYYGDDSTFEMYVPLFRRVLNMNNAIDTTSCIFLMDNKDKKLKRPMFSVSGSRIVFNRFCLAYTRNGQKYYTHLYNASKVSSPIDKLYLSKKDAAQDGYVYDVTLESS